MNSTFNISEELKAELGFCGVIIITSRVNYEKLSETVQKKVNSIIKEIDSRYSTKEEIRQIPQIKKVRDAMSSLGRDPKRYPNSAEALIKRIISRKPLYQINNIVDFNNYLSLKYIVPVGSYDLSEIAGNIIFRKGASNDTYQSLSKDNFNLEYVPLLSDDKGAFGSIISDSKRTLITPNTNQIFTVMFFFDDKKADFSRISSELEKLYHEVLNAQEVKICYHE